MDKRRRLESLLARLENPGEEAQRVRRALEILELIGTEEARVVLRTMSQGAECRAAREAQAALTRLSKTRGPIKPQPERDEP